MAYSAPELLLVGAAQNLVLGPDFSGVPCGFKALEPQEPTDASDELELW